MSEASAGTQLSPGSCLQIEAPFAARGAFCLVVATLLLAVLTTGGCKLVKNAPQEQGGQAAATVSGGRGGDMTALVDSIWNDKVVPHLKERAADAAALGPALRADLATAGQTYGYRTSSEGSPWNFSVLVHGRVLAARTDTRAATADVDVDGDGQADVVLQLGPVIRGTALRDVLPFIDFSSFKDQIEFAKLSRALNAKAYEAALKNIPREALVGRRVEALGAFTMRDSGAAILVTPVRAAFE